jgi:SAM-dependent methyltransferase
MALFKLKKSGGPRDLDLSMAGLKLGSRVLQLGNDGELSAVLGAAVGISGEACAVTDDETVAARIGRAATAAGVLVDVRVAPFGALPYEVDAFDVVVLGDVIGRLYINERVVCLQQVLRVLRPGGRCLVIERAARGGLGAVFSHRSLDPGYRAGGGAVAALAAEGFRAVRVLAEHSGKSFIEGTK